ncbi:MAG: hypothetical protein J6O62_03015 [Bacilli bacterium]|nr:hypothetical protein [Bacilli bacterium]
MEKIIEELKKYMNENNPTSKYSEEEYIKAATILSEFFDKLDNMRIYKENNRKLNKLERFIEIYNFVGNRVYKEQGSSHDLIGVLLTDKSVCQGFCQLMEFICKRENIPFLYKNVYTYDENDKAIGSHGNFEVIVQDNNGNKHCLHCDPTIDCPKTKEDVLSYNAFLIEDKEINSYYHTQEGEGDTGFYMDLMSNIEIYINKMDFVDEVYTLFNPKDEIIQTRYDNLRQRIIKLNEFFKFDLDLNENSTKSEIKEAYRLLKKKYEEISNGIDKNELTNAILNVCVSEKVYDDRTNVEKSVKMGIEEYNKKAEKTNKNNEKFWKKYNNQTLELV